jgi:predicted nuclease of restriction endonuclease-like (RecB) superfamily
MGFDATTIQKFHHYSKILDANIASDAMPAVWTNTIAYYLRVSLVDQGGSVSREKRPKKSTRVVVEAASREERALVPSVLLNDLCVLIRQTRQHVAQSVNSALVLLYWQIGYRIRTEILKETRAQYGDEILSTLSKELVAEFGNGFSVPNLSRMMRLAEVLPDGQIVSTLSKELGWSHFVEIIPLPDHLQRDFYAEMCRIERWSVRTLRSKIQGMLFERTALSRKPAELARHELAALREEDKLTPDLVFRDPYFLDFLGLADTYSENDLETAILRELERFILELGSLFMTQALEYSDVIGRRSKGTADGRCEPQARTDDCLRRWTAWTSRRSRHGSYSDQNFDLSPV